MVVADPSVVEDEAEVKAYLHQYIREHGFAYCAECRGEMVAFRYRQDVGAVCIPCNGAIEIASKSPATTQ